jgi:hypothetical protein
MPDDKKQFVNFLFLFIGSTRHKWETQTTFSFSGTAPYNDIRRLLIPWRNGSPALCLVRRSEARAKTPERPTPSLLPTIYQINIDILPKTIALFVSTKIFKNPNET